MTVKHRRAASATTTAGFPRRGHNHASCVDDAVAAADRVCAQNGTRLTELRRQVLELVWRSHEPVGAYAILEHLAVDSGRRPAPPTVYRALDFLLEQGLVHRIESRNAFFGCTRPGEKHLFEILLCTDCGRAAEVPGDRVTRAVKFSAAALGFEVDRQTVEVMGRCRDCRGPAAQA
ncbi:MAG TPA: Fur family transcriptional regulator [Candidatus Sulfotelmatobacter sp.]|nr:Fur family transcriptional regulator [Candidatus Sulfotelmatobacter sp.]